MIRSVLYSIAWEWINICLEYTSISWLRLPKRFLSVLYVNLLTHPLFVLCFPDAGQNGKELILCEIVIFLVEGVVLTLFYERHKWKQTFLAAFVMNASSCLTGVLLIG